MGPLAERSALTWTDSHNTKAGAAPERTDTNSTKLQVVVGNFNGMKMTEVSIQAPRLCSVSTMASFVGRRHKCVDGMRVVGRRGRAWYQHDPSLHSITSRFQSCFIVLFAALSLAGSCVTQRAHETLL